MFPVFFYFVFRLSAQVKLVIGTDNREMPVSLIVRIKSVCRNQGYEFGELGVSHYVHTINSCTHTSLDQYMWFVFSMRVISLGDIFL